jgi:lysyl-tRNA synthetase class 1
MGGGAKMSSSTGNVLTITDLLKVYDKNIIWWFYARVDNMHAFDIALDNDVIRYYSEFDRWVKLYFNGNIDDKNRSILDLTNVKEDYLKYPNFSYLATFLPIVNFDIELLKELLSKESIDVNTKEFAERLELAKNWVKEYGADYQVNLLNERNNEFYETLSDLEKEWLSKTIDLLNEEFKTTDELQTALYSVVKDGVLVDKELKQTQKRYFQILYNMLLGKDQGPKLGLFLIAIDKEKKIAFIKISDFKNLLKNYEKVLKKYSRYLFRYLLLGFSSAVGNSQVHSIAEKSHKMLSKATKIPTIKSHVAQGANINSVVANKLVNPYKIRETRVFFFAKKLRVCMF